jgi:hypothetical protein
MRVKNGAWIALNTLLRSKENCYQFDDTSENYYHWYCLRLDRGKGNVITIYDIVKEMRATLPSWTAAQNLISTQSWWLGLGTLYKIQPQHHPHRLYREKIMIGDWGIFTRPNSQWACLLDRGSGPRQPTSNLLAEHFDRRFPHLEKFGVFRQFFVFSLY